MSWASLTMRPVVALPDEALAVGGQVIAVFSDEEFDDDGVREAAFFEDP